MNATFTDILGNQLAVGDEIAIAFPDGGSNAYLRVGKIIGVSSKETQRWNRHLNAYFPGPPDVSLEVEWNSGKSGGSVPAKPTKIKYPKGRMIKLG